MSKNSQTWLCEYCGEKWTESLILWTPSPTKCLKCGETQLLRKLKHGEYGGSNPFGYPEDEKQDVSHEYQD